MVTQSAILISCTFRKQGCSIKLHFRRLCRLKTAQHILQRRGFLSQVWHQKRVFICRFLTLEGKAIAIKSECASTSVEHCNSGLHITSYKWIRANVIEICCCGWHIMSVWRRVQLILVYHTHNFSHWRKSETDTTISGDHSIRYALLHNLVVPRFESQHLRLHQETNSILVIVALASLCGVKLRC